MRLYVLCIFGCLTGLRFFAALLVVSYHFVQNFHTLDDLKWVTGFGFTGVTFFFILSGFVLTWSYKQGTSVKVFYWRRLARVWPLHAVTTGLAILVALGTGFPLIWESFPHVLTLMQAWWPNPAVNYGFNGASWSLSAEVFFYLMFPALILVIKPHMKLWTIVAATFLTMAIVGCCVVALMQRPAVNYLLYVLPAYRIGEFIIGICLALLIKRGWSPWFSLKQAVVATVLGYAGLMAVTSLVLDTPAELPGFMTNLWVIPGFVAVIVAAAAGDLTDRGGLVRSNLLVRLGQWSFALYLVHEPIMKIVEPLIAGWGVLPTVGVSAATICFAVGVSGVAYEWVERPVEKWLRGLASQRSVGV